MMRKQAWCILCCVLAGASMPARADGPKTADEVIAKYIEAIGGRKAIDSIRSMKTTGKFVMGGGVMEAPMIIEAKRPNKVRTEFTFQGMTAIQAFDGKIGWSIMPFMGKTDPEQMPPDQVKVIKEEADMDGPLVDYKKKGHQIELVGKDEVEGSEVYKLKVTKKGGDVDYYYLDAEYFLPIKRAGKREMQGSQIDFEAIYGDYKKVGGLMIAHSITNRFGPMGESTVSLEKIEVNVPLADDRFTMPKIEKPAVSQEDKAKAAGELESKPTEKEKKD